LLPFGAWALFQFRAHAAAFVFTIWLVIGVTIAYFAHAGAKLERETTGSPSSAAGLDGALKRTFFKTTKNDCLAEPSKFLPAKLSVPGEKIVSYCDCYAVGIASATTPAELTRTTSAGKPPASLAEKMMTFRQFCTAEIFGNKSKY
jgi:hypothetical protein